MTCVGGRETTTGDEEQLQQQTADARLSLVSREDCCQAAVASREQATLFSGRFPYLFPRYESATSYRINRSLPFTEAHVVVVGS